MEIKNGSTIHRAWKDHDSTELIAVLQYDAYAEKICKTLLPDMPEGTYLIYTCHYSGKMVIFHPEKKQ